MKFQATNNVFSSVGNSKHGRVTVPKIYFILHDCMCIGWPRKTCNGLSGNDFYGIIREMNNF